MFDDMPSLDNFDGLARLFPLPNVVLFPRVIQPLHIFEPQYKHLTADALAHDRLIALAYSDKTLSTSIMPGIHPILCLGKIFQEEKLPDGRYNLLLHGVARARILREVKSGRQYRMAKVEILHDIPPASEGAAKDLREELGQRMVSWFGNHAATKEQVLKLLEGDLSLGNLCDIFSFALPMECGMKMDILEMLDVEERALFLNSQLKSLPPLTIDPDSTMGSQPRYPCQFSDN